MKVIANIKEHMNSDDDTMAFGEIELEENEISQTVNMSMWQIERACKIIHEMGIGAVQIRIQNNMPMLITNEYKPKDGTKPQKLKGILIAPRIHEEE